MQQDTGARSSSGYRGSHRLAGIAAKLGRAALCAGVMAALGAAAPVGAAAAAPLPPGQGVLNGHPGHDHGHGPGGRGWGAGGHYRGRRVEGMVSGVGPTGFDLTTAKGTVFTVDVPVSTTVREPGVRDASLADVVDGEEVVVTGAMDGSDLEATSVTIPSASLAGTVLSVGSGSFTLTATSSDLLPLRGGPVIVDVSGTTRYREPGQSRPGRPKPGHSSPRQSPPGLSSPGLAGVLAGDIVVVEGSQAGPATVDATYVSVPLAVVVGDVTSAGTTSFSLTSTSSTLRSPKGTAYVIDVSAGTRYHGPGTQGPGYAGPTAGQRVVVVGAQAGPATVDANSVTVVPTRSHGRHRYGPGPVRPVRRVGGDHPRGRDRSAPKHPRGGRGY